MRRAVALGLLLFGCYAATLGLRAFDGSRHAGAAPHYLLAAKSIVDDHDLDVSDQYAARSYASFYPRTLAPHGVRRPDGQVYERYGLGFPLLIAPAYALGGQTAVQLMLAAMAALAIALAYRLALRVVPDPWAIGAAAAVGLSPPLLASSTAVAPDLVAALALVAAALLAVRLDEHVSRRGAFACFLALATLPWLGLQFVPLGLVVGAFAARSVARARRRTLALGSTEVAFFSLALYVGITEAFYDSPWPYAGVSAFGAGEVGDYVARATRLVALFADRDVGLLRWAPTVALAGVGAWMLYRSRRDQLARAMPQLRAMQRTATLCALAAGVQVPVVAFFAPTIYGGSFAAQGLLAGLVLAVPLVAMGLRRLPRLGGVLVVLTLAASVWLYVAVRFGSAGLAENRPPAPFGPLADVLPRFGDGSAADHLVAAAVALVVIAALAWEAWRWRHESAPPEGAPARAG